MKLTIIKENTKVKMKGLSKRISRLFTPLEILPHYPLRARGPSLRAVGSYEPEAGAEPGPAAAVG
jgi:hypothetical protein